MTFYKFFIIFILVIIVLYNRTMLDNIIDVSSLIVMNYTTVQQPNSQHSSPDAFDFYKLIYIDRGPYTLISNGVEYNLNEGDCFLHTPNVSYKGVPQNVGKTIGVISFESSSPILKSLENVVVTLKMQDRKLFFKLLREGLPLFELAKNGIKLKGGVSKIQVQPIKNRLELLLISMLVTAKGNAENASLSEDNSAAQLSQQVYNFLELNLNTNLSLNLLSRTFGVSTSHLKTAFKSTYKCSIIDKFIELKIDKAKGYIRDFDYNITEISEMLAFSSPQYFSRIFKQRTGLTPTEYKRKMGL